MRLVRRPLAPHEIDFELVWLVVSLGGLVLAAIWLRLGLPWPICLFHEWTGHPCISCGATRAALAFFRGDWETSLRWNPLAFFAYGGIAIFDIYAGFAVVFRARRWRLTAVTSRDTRFFRVIILGAMVLNWAYLLLANQA